MGIRRGSISTPIIVDGLVFNMDAANRASYPRTGTKSFNTIDTTTTGSLDGTTFQSTLPLSFNFDGVDDNIDFGTISEINGLNKFSFNVWLTTPSQNAGDSIAFGNRDSSNSYRGIALSLQPNPSTASIYFYFVSNVGSGGSWVEIPAANYIANAWNNFAITYDGSTLTAIVNNGTPITSNQPSKVLNSTTNFRMGRDGWNSSLYEGNIGPVQIYNRALSANEVLHNYNALKSRFE
tara:strand:- start:815 stop:1522 length:708 start_codon:yes stop_codon:yes gene_type:complete